MIRYFSFSFALVAWVVIAASQHPAMAQDQVLPASGGLRLSRTAVPPLINSDAVFSSKTLPEASPAATRTPVPDGVLIENNQLKIKDGFGAQFWIVDSEEFFLNWLRSDVRNLVPVTLARRGVPLYIAVFLLDPGTRAGPRGVRCDVTYDYEVLRPDGGCLDARKNYVAWASARPPSPHIIQLSVSNIPEPVEQTGGRQVPRYPKVMLGVIDPPGEYIINVLVHDNVKKVDIALQRKLTLEE